MATKRKSYHLNDLREDLRKRALKEKNEEKRTDYWRLYYKTFHIESEVREMVMDAEIRNLLEIALAYGMLPDNWKDEIARLEEDKANEENKPPVDSSIDDDDIPPRQTGLWDA